MSQSNSHKESPLVNIKEFLSDVEAFTTKHLLPDEEYPYERLVINVGSDEAGRDYSASIYFIDNSDFDDDEDADDDADEADAEESEDSEDDDGEIEDDILFLQFFMELPIEIDAKHEDALAHWLLTLNGILPAGAFNIARSKEGSSIYYLYNWACQDDDIDPLVFMELLSIMTFFCQEFATLTEAIALGKKTLKDGHKALVEQGLYSPGMQL